MTVRVEELSGAALEAAVPALARLRMRVFRDWPYLYDGSLAYEQGYLRTFAGAPKAVVIAAFDADEMVGAATASSLAGHAAEFAVPLAAHGHDVQRVFYFGESVLLKPYRGRGLGHVFFDRREAHARSAGRYTHATFCSVVRPEHHPLRPAGYVPLDAFWRKRGYDKIENLLGSFSWKDIDRPFETAKPMQYWIKALPP
jgi:GNAT superfamily N-acetyltransferase